MRQNTLSRTTSAAPATDATDVVRHDDPRLLPTGITPASVLNLGPVVAGQRTGQNHFLLQEARDGDPAITIVSQPTLAGGFEELPYFTVNTADTAVALRASVGGPTTSGSLYARCELRELDQSGADMAFDALTGTHRLRTKFTVIADPAVKPDVVVMQLHNGTTDRVAIRTQLVSGTLRLRCRINGTSHATELANPYVLGTEYDVQVEIVDGTVNVSWSTGGAALPGTPQITQAAALSTTGSASWYFKTGCYLQSQVGVDDVATEYGQVELRDLTHWHTGWPTPTRYYPVAQHGATHTVGAGDDLSATYVPWVNVAAANGVASLDSGGKIPQSQVPAIAPPNGTPPELNGVAAWNFDPINAATSLLASSGVTYLQKVILARSTLVTGIDLRIAVAGATVSTGYVGIYDSTGARVGVSANQTTAWTTTGDKVIPLTAPVTLPAGTYWVAFLTQATTIPRPSGSAIGGINFGVTVGAALRAGMFGTGLSALPATITLSSMTQNTLAVPWVGLY